MTAVGTSLAGISQFHKFGKIDYRLAWPAALLSIAGAVIGTIYVTAFMLRKGDRFIEIIFMLITFVMGLKLLISVA